VANRAVTSEAIETLEMKRAVGERDMKPQMAAAAVRGTVTAITLINMAGSFAKTPWPSINEAIPGELASTVAAIVTRPGTSDGS